MSKNNNYLYFETIDQITKDKNKFFAVDVGANTGEVTKYFSEHWSKVLAFEPTPSTFKELLKNVDKNVQCENIGLSDSSGTLTFATGPNPRINQIVSENFYKKGWTTINIPVKTLDSLNLLDVDLLKIDVEGHERQVVLGAKNLIKTCKPLIIIEISFENKVYDKEISKDHTHALTILESWGYSIIKKHRHDYILSYKE
tara:strand:+ start:3558 stop:4154 length:597 start_codon:yes stop_codon:yes gene_type:complete